MSTQEKKAIAEAMAYTELGRDVDELKEHSTKESYIPKDVKAPTKALDYNRNHKLLYNNGEIGIKGFKKPVIK